MCRQQGGDYARNTKYTILTASTGVVGTYSGVTSNLAFLSPTLSYDSSDVYLTLVSSNASFQRGSQTVNQVAVARVLDNYSNTATGDFGTVINGLFNLDTVQGPQALNTISGQPIANFGTTNVAAGLAVMGTIGNVLSGFHGGASSAGQRVAMASEDVEACEALCTFDSSHPFGAWVSGVGGTGSVQGGANAGGLAYGFAGVAVGIDYTLTSNFRMGIGGGYTGGTQWVNGIDGKGTTDAYSGFAYASFNPGEFYIDGLAGYAYSNNRSIRPIAIPGLSPRIAQGNAGASQFLGQIETGYRLDLTSALAVTPFARLQGATTTQSGFTETGADSLNLSVASQTTNSLRTTFGGEVTAEAGPLQVGVRLGWVHEHADVSRPMTASFQGAAGQAFTVFGATPQRDSAAVGFALKTQIAESTTIYARYDGEVGGGSDNHAFSGGLRISW